MYIICITGIVIYTYDARLIRYSEHCDTTYTAVYANRPPALHYYCFRLQRRLTCLIGPCLRNERIYMRSVIYYCRRINRSRFGDIFSRHHAHDIIIPKTQNARTCEEEEIGIKREPREPNIISEFYWNSVAPSDMSVDVRSNNNIIESG